MLRRVPRQRTGTGSTPVTLPDGVSLLSGTNPLGRQSASTGEESDLSSHTRPLDPLDVTAACLGVIHRGVGVLRQYRVRLSQTGVVTNPRDREARPVPIRTLGSAGAGLGSPR
jgi:hypothetical protein